jgi:polyisoprenoid-binding protein YceI
MKLISLIICFLCTSIIASAQYKPVPEGSSIKFKIKNFGFDVTGSFGGLQGNIHFDPQNESADSFDVSIDASTINTDNSLRDKHLKDETYFDINNYPRIRLVSSKVAADKSGAYILTGQLTIKGKSKAISFPFTAIPSDDGYAFKGSFKIERKDFGVGGTSTISNQLEVFLMVYAKKS